MKTTVKSIILLSVVTTSTAFTDATVKTIDVASSSIEWKGKKVLGSHTGTIKIQEGYLSMDGDKLVGGKVVVDMSSIKVTDLQGESKEKLEGHLKSDDFFGIENHPTSVLNIKGSKKTESGYLVNGTITIKGITELITFNLEMKENKAIAHVKIDRTKFNVRFGSGSFFDNLGDNTISDNFELDVELAF